MVRNSTSTLLAIIWFIKKRNCVYGQEQTALSSIFRPGDLNPPRSLFRGCFRTKTEAETISVTPKQDQNTDMSSVEAHSNHRRLGNSSRSS